MTIADPRARLMDLAAKQIGYRERPTNDNVFAKEMGWANGYAWCASFVCAVFKRAGMLDLIPTPSAGCDQLAAGFKDRGRWHTTPKAGDVVFYGKPTDLSHCGLVESYTATTLTAIEGNTNGTGSREGDGVYRKTRARNGYVIGYGRPAYPRPTKVTRVDRARSLLKVAMTKRKPAEAAKIRAALEALKGLR